jgi:hypothetical protein
MKSSGQFLRKWLHYIGIDHYFSFSLPTKFSRLTPQGHHGLMQVDQHRKSWPKLSGVVIFTNEISNEVQRTLNYIILALICVVECLINLHHRSCMLTTESYLGLKYFWVMQTDIGANYNFFLAWRSRHSPSKMALEPLWMGGLGGSLQSCLVNTAPTGWL